MGRGEIPSDLTDLQQRAIQVALPGIEKDLAVLRGRLARHLTRKTRKSFDESLVRRWPEGTPVNPVTGEGGGRFAPKDDLVGGGDAAGFARATENRLADLRRARDNEMVEIDYLRRHYRQDKDGAWVLPKWVEENIAKLEASVSDLNEQMAMEEKVIAGGWQQDDFSVAYLRDTDLPFAPQYDLFQVYAENNRDWVVSEMGKQEGITDPAEIERLIVGQTQAIAEWVDAYPVSIRVDWESAEGILSSGHFLNQFDANKSNGNFGPEIRREAERLSFGVPDDAPGFDRPIYGYLDIPSSSDKVFWYGNVQFVLKEDVKRRATMTLGDSLSTTAQGWPMTKADMMPMAAWSEAAYVVESMVNGHAPERMRVYIEAQVFGGVTIQDVEKVIIWHGGDAESENLQKMLTDAGIPFDVQLGH